MMANIPKLRLYIRDNIDSDKIIYLNEKQSHYLVNVRRSNIGDFIALFNGRDGEWIAEIKSIEKKIVSLNIIKCLRIQEKQTNIWLAFAPIKRGRIDLIAEKATELGVSRLIPVITARTQTTRVNTARLRANAH
jgi:16S rRNA (uracil1498-N3)-methyltransferase